LLDCPKTKSLFALPVLCLIYVIGQLHSHIRHPSTVPPAFARLAAACPPLGGRGLGRATRYPRLGVASTLDL